MCDKWRVGNVECEKKYFFFVFPFKTLTKLYGHLLLHIVVGHWNVLISTHTYKYQTCKSVFWGQTHADTHIHINIFIVIIIIARINICTLMFVCVWCKHSSAAAPKLMSTNMSVRIYAFISVTSAAHFCPNTREQVSENA